MKRIGIWSIAALFLSASVAAAQQGTSTNPLSESFRGFTAQYAAYLVAAFDSIPADKYGYSPTPVQKTVGYIAQHVESSNYQLCERIGGTKRAMTARDSLADTIKAQWPKDTLTARIKASFAFCKTALEGVNDAGLVDRIPLGAPGSNRTIPRGTFIMGLVTDLVDHYSQIAGYMRLNGMVPPSALPRRR